MKWTESLIHVAMRSALRLDEWELVAGEYPGGTDHELYPLNIVDRRVARDGSPDPRRHSTGELIPDLVALKNRTLLIIEAKVRYNAEDHQKLKTLLHHRRADLEFALEKFANERGFQSLLPIDSLQLRPVLAFGASSEAPESMPGISYLRVIDSTRFYFEGDLGGPSD